MKNEMQMGKKGFSTINAHWSPHFIFYSALITQTPKWNHTDWVSICLTVCTCCCCTAMWGVYTKDSSMWLPVIWLFQELVIQQHCNPSLPKRIQLWLTLPFLSCNLAFPSPNRNAYFHNSCLESISSNPILSLSFHSLLCVSCFSCWSKVAKRKSSMW